MTATIFGIMNAARLGLAAQQEAIDVTGQNVANASTVGYSRQDITFAPTPGQDIGNVILGTGVQLANVQRAHDQFIFSQIVDEQSATSNTSIRKDVFGQLEALFNQTTGQGLSSSLNSFFSSAQDLSTNPTGLAQRSAVVSAGSSLVLGLNQTSQSLFQNQLSLDQNIQSELTNINSLTSQIADLNKNIHATEADGKSANDLRDQRDTLIKNLSSEVDVNLMSEVNGEVSITLKNGSPLVLANTASTLQTKINGDNKAFKDVLIADASGKTTNVTSIIQSGKLRGMLDMRDKEIPKVQDVLDRFTAGLVREVNSIHQNGQGLDGISGRNFFNDLQPIVHNSTTNTGNANVAIVNASPSTTSVDKYEFTFTGANTVSLKNLTTGFASGTYSFTRGSAFDVAGGLSVTITGTAAVGDRTQFSISENAASTISINSQIISDASKVAAGLTSASDGANAQNLAELQNALDFNGTSITSPGSGAYTFNDFYNTITANLGVASQTAQTTATEQAAVMTQLQNRQQSSDGVNLDEEMINMIKFQQAYSASARVLTTVADMLTVLQNVHT